jgi:hypothetical protein
MKAGMHTSYVNFLLDTFTVTEEVTRSKFFALKMEAAAYF